jgi:hypothetical protein
MMTLAESLFKNLFSFRALVYALLTTVLIGCAFGKDTDLAACGGASSENLGAHSSAFSATLYPSLVSNNCNQCHDGSGKAPYGFASSDAASSVASALKLVSLKAPSDSRFISKVGQELHQCGSDPNRCGVIAAEFQVKIQEWAEQTKDIEVPSCDGNYVTLTSNARTILPSDLSTTANKAYTFDLNGQSAGLGQLGFYIEARLIQPPAGASSGVYILRAPTVATSEKKLKVGPIKLLINGAVDPGYSNYSGVDYVVDFASFNMSANIWNFPWVSTSTQLVAWEQPLGDNLSFQVSVATTEEPADSTNTDFNCYQRAQFVNTVWPLFNKAYGQGRCVDCHAGGNANATNAFSLTLSSDQCTETIKKVNFTTPATSIIFRKARDGAQNHRQLLANQPADVNAIIEWIQAEGASR